MASLVRARTPQSAYHARARRRPEKPCPTVRFEAGAGCAAAGRGALRLDGAPRMHHVSLMTTRNAFYFGYFTYGPPARGVLLRAR